MGTQYGSLNSLGVFGPATSTPFPINVQNSKYQSHYVYIKDKYWKTEIIGENNYTQDSKLVTNVNIP